MQWRILNIDGYEERMVQYRVALFYRWLRTGGELYLDYRRGLVHVEAISLPSNTDAMPLV
jgi:hypothetical protein